MTNSPKNKTKIVIRMFDNEIDGVDQVLSADAYFEFSKIMISKNYPEYELVDIETGVACQGIYIPRQDEKCGEIFDECDDSEDILRLINDNLADADGWEDC